MVGSGNGNKLLNKPAAILFFAAAAALAAGAAWAAVPDAAPVDAFISQGIALSGAVGTTAYAAAVRLFWRLALIQFVWSAMQLALRGGWTMAHIVSLLAKEIMFIGFFYWLLLQGNPNASPGNVPLTEMLARGLRFLAGTGAGGEPLPINPASFLFTCLESLHKLTNAAFQLGVYNAVWAVVPYALTLVSFCFAAAFATVYLLEYYVVLPAGIILLGLGGTEWTKRFATNYVRVLISVGFKLLCLQIVLTAAGVQVAAAGAAFNDVSALAADGFFQNAFKFAGFSAVIFLSVKTIPQTAASLVSGAFFGRANWMEPASFPPLAEATAGYAPSGQPSGGGEGTRGVTGTVSALGTSGFAGVQPGAAEYKNPVASSLSSGAAAAGQAYSSFQGAGFGNYAHDIIFDNDRPGGAASQSVTGAVNVTGAGGLTGGAMPDARGSFTPDARGTTITDARAGGIPDARGATITDAGNGGIPDARGGGIPDARGTTIPDARGGGMPDARGTTIPDARGGVIPDARGTTIPDARGEVIPDARGTTIPDARGGVIPDARGATIPDARGSVIPDARGTTIPDARGGVIPDARGATIPDARGEVIPDARGTTIPDARGGVIPDARGTTIPDARGGGIPDARGTTIPDARGGAGIPDARGGAGIPDARGGAGIPDARGGAGIPDARGGAGMPDARGGAGMPDARGGAGMPDARGGVGMPDAAGAAGMPDARPAPTSADMRQAMRDSMKNG
ncbi:MAG: type IV secretion system protein [Synergistaceae bacterium]|jgi:type IV secretion system protein TrbL|nr:type IV secretion system protein [Synergistaceae bacterium]